MNRDGFWRHTSATRLLGIEMPIVLGLFGGLPSVKLTVAVSEAGALVPTGCMATIMTESPGPRGTWPVRRRNLSC